jgi:hypothetical protein
MTNYCTNCGAPVSGAFCVQCGNRVGTPAVQPEQPPYAAPAPPAPAPVTKGGPSAAKILLIVFGVFFLLGALGIASIVYVAYRAKQRVEQIGRDYGIELPHKASELANVPGGSFPHPAGSGCPALTGDQAARILGMQIDRVEFKPNSSDGMDVCEFYVNPAARKRIAGDQISTAIARLGNSAQSDKQNVRESERLVTGALNALQNSVNDKDGFDFTIEVARQHGKEMWEKIDEIQNGLRAQSGMGVESVEGLGDQALIIPGGLHTFVLKGDALLKLSFVKFAPSREKAVALASQALASL